MVPRNVFDAFMVKYLTSRPQSARGGFHVCSLEMKLPRKGHVGRPTVLCGTSELFRF